VIAAAQHGDQNVTYSSHNLATPATFCHVRLGLYGVMIQLKKTRITQVGEEKRVVLIVYMI
jgi:hypothetical protein